VSSADTSASLKDIAVRRRGVRFSLPRLRGGTWAGIIILAIALAVAVFGPLLQTFDPNDFSYNMNIAPNAENWLGTDDQGQDIYSRLIAGTRLSLGFGAAAAMTALLLGGILALVGLAFGRIGDVVVFGLVDLIRALPGILFALALIVALEPGTLSVILALGVSFSPNFARITRATYFQEMARTYVAAAQTFGAGKLRIALVHILPNIAGALITQFAIVLPRCIVSEAVLSFLGLGVSPELSTWGRMISSASEFTEEAPHAVIIPIIVLSVVTFGLAMIGDEMRRRYDPARRRIAE